MFPSNKFETFVNVGKKICIFLLISNKIHLEWHMVLRMFIIIYSKKFSHVYVKQDCKDLECAYFFF